MHDAVEVSEGGAAVAGKSPRQLAVMRFKRDKSAMIVAILSALFVIIALLSPLLNALGIIKPNAQHPELLDKASGGLPASGWGGMSWSHPLGIVPGSGTDVLSRIVLGTGTSLMIALSASLLTVIIGVVLGIVSGASGGWVDGLIGRVIDLTLSFPQTLMLLALSGGALIFLQETLHIRPANLAAGIYVVVVLAIFGWCTVARLLRGQVLSLREREFVDAAKVLGASRGRIYFKEMLPNLWAPILVLFTQLLPSYVSAEAALSYLGVGIKAPTPTLGNILTDSINYDSSDFVYFFFPAFTIAFIVVCFNLFGDALRDALDPRSDR